MKIEVLYLTNQELTESEWGIADEIKNPISYATPPLEEVNEEISTF